MLLGISWISILYWVAVIAFAIVIVFDIPNETYKEYVKYRELTIKKGAGLGTIRNNLDRMISILVEELKNHSNKREQEDLDAYIAFLCSIAKWENVSNIQICLNKNTTPEWLTILVKRKFFLIIRNIFICLSVCSAFFIVWANYMAK